MFLDRRLLCVVLAGCMVGLGGAARADDPAPPPAPPPAIAPPPPADPPPPPSSTPSATGDATSGVPTPAPVAPPETTPTPGAVLAPTPTSSVVSTTPRTDIAYVRPRPGLLAAGLVLFVAGWAADIGFTYGYHHDPAYTSLIPLVGPFIQMTQHYGLDGPAINTGSSDADARINRNLDTANTTIRALAITGAAVSALLQVAGLSLTLAGALTRRKVTRYALSGSGATLRF